jgi:2-dehydro-3-deoxy-D-arabinonate dehydratase
MHVVRFVDSDSDVHIGLFSPEGMRPVRDVNRVADLLRLPLDKLRALLQTTAQQTPQGGHTRLLPPIDGLTEVWASGVTYQRSRQARVEESSERSVYDRVYDADRPELFYKSVAWRVVTDGEPIGIRSDSALNVPEPELAVVTNAFGEIVGYSVCNDVSSRTIEGDNPLYLPQAKVYTGSCALATGIRPAWEVPDHGSLDVTLLVSRRGKTVYEGRTCTSEIRRNLDDLVEHLYRAQAFPEGAFLATGTGIVPDIDFTLEPGDIVNITVERVGELTNTVADAGELTQLAAVGHPLPRKETA